MSTLHIGDFLLRPKLLGISHVGIWMGGGAVFHNAPDRGEHISSVADFAKGEKVTVEPTLADPAIVVARVRSKLFAPRVYDILSNNCEHSATHVVTGRAFSRQMQTGVAIIIGLGLLYLALRRR
jgi:hypothetical protein